jgi:hypothetical protein
MGYPEDFECCQCRKTYNSNQSPSDYFCQQICQDIWTRVKAKQLDPEFGLNMPSTPPIPIGPGGNPFRWIQVAG